MSTMDLLKSGNIFCRTCLATGDNFQYSEIDTKKQYFDEFKIEHLSHPRCAWLCAECIGRINMILEFRSRVANITSLLKEAIERIKNEQSQISNSENFLEDKSVAWVLKSETIEADFDGAEFDNDADDLPLYFIKREGEAKRDNGPVKKPKKDKKSKSRKKRPKDGKFSVILLTRTEQMEESREMSKSSKYQNSVYKCEHCVKGFGYESTYRNHMTVHEPNPNCHKCDMCEMYIASRRSFAKHVANHAKRFRCSRCGFTKRTRRGVVEHYGAEHEADKHRVDCLLCGKVFFKKSVLRQHMQYRHAENKERQECEHCGTTFRTIESLRRHMLKHTTQDLPEKEKRFPCGVCGKKYLNATLLRIHKRSHDSERNFYCKLCDKFYKSEIILKCHIKYSSKHYDQDKRIPCPHCDKRLVDQRDLSRHVEKDHLGIADHKCRLCPRAYYTNNLLRVHVKRSHEKCTFPKVHMCDYCGKTFNMRKNLICHINTHTGEKPFACGECDARFGHSGVLSMHVKLVHRKLKRNAKGKVIAPTAT